MRASTSVTQHRWERLRQRFTSMLLKKSSTGDAANGTGWSFQSHGSVWV